MSALENGAELTRLAALLRVEESELEFLAGQSLETLRELRDKVIDRLFDADRGVLESIAKANKMVPGALAAKIATTAFPPSLAARVAGVMDTEGAVDMARRVPVSFLADLAPALDPRRVTAILARLPGQLLVDAGELLGERGEYIAMADFVGVLPDAQIERTLGVLSDEALVRTGLVIEDAERVAAILGMLPAERLAGVVEVAASIGEWDGIRRARPYLAEEVYAALTRIVEERGIAVPDDLR